MVTRYINEKDIGFVFYEGSRSNKQRIELFHENLHVVKFLRISDLVIDHFPLNSIAVNRLYLQASSAPLEQLYKKYKTWTSQNTCDLERVNVLHEEASKVHESCVSVEDCLKMIRSLEFVINKKALNDLSAQYPDLDTLADIRNEIEETSKELELSKQADRFKTTCEKRIELFKQSLMAEKKRYGVENSGTCDRAQALSSVETIFKDSFEMELKKFSEDLVHIIDIEVKNYEQEEMHSMKRRLRYCTDVKKSIGNCEYAIKKDKKLKNEVENNDFVAKNNGFCAKLKKEIGSELQTVKMLSNQIERLARTEYTQRFE